MTDQDGELPADARLAVNFNGQSREWFVLQYRLEEGEAARIALVVVDDDTGQVIRYQTED